MSDDNKGNFKKFAIGTALAAAAGYVTGILTAPKSGKETRADIKQGALAGKLEAEKQLKRIHTELSELLDEAKTKGSGLGDKATKEFDELILKAKRAKEKAREVLSAVHEGGADDKDLEKAMIEANKAIEHIRTYLKK